MALDRHDNNVLLVSSILSRDQLLIWFFSFQLFYLLCVITFCSNNLVTLIHLHDKNIIMLGINSLNEWISQIGKIAVKTDYL